MEREKTNPYVTRIELTDKLGQMEKDIKADIKTLSSKQTDDNLFNRTLLKKEVSTPIVVTGGFRSVASMEDVIIQNNTDFIGMARPFILKPNIVNDIKSNDFSNITLPRLTTGIKNMDKALGPILANSYYNQQMKRIGNNKSIIIKKNAWLPLLSSFSQHGKTALTRLRE